MTQTVQLALHTPLFTPNGQTTVALSAMMGEPNLQNIHKAMSLTKDYFDRFDLAYAHTIASSRSYNPSTSKNDYSAMFTRVMKIFYAIPSDVMDSIHNDIVENRKPDIPKNVLSVTSDITRHFPDTFGSAFQIAMLPQELSGHFMPEGWTLTGPLTLEETPSAEMLAIWQEKTKQPLYGKIPSIPSVTYNNGGNEKGILLGAIRDLPHELIHLRQATSTNKDAQKNNLHAMAEEARTVTRIMGTEKVARAASLAHDIDSEHTLDGLIMFSIGCATIPPEKESELMNEIGVSRGKSIGAILSLAGILERHPDFIEKKSESRIAYELVAYRHENAIVLPTFD